ncbi:MAG: 16S rRNA processing protein RimM [Bacilli bacterium]|nr:16S rRNA processing protein RimM [Bacilli bacterium]
MKEYVRLGQITKTRGLKGEVRCFSLTSFAKERFKKGTTLSLFNERSEERIEMNVESFSNAGDYYFLKLSGMNSIEEAENYLHWFIEIDKDKAPLPEGYFRYEDIKGCKIIDDATNNVLGVAVGILDNAPTKTVKVQKEDKKTFYFPLEFKQFVVSMDLENKEIRINVIEGLL